MLCSSITSWGYNFEVDGIYYTVNSTPDPTVTVVSGDMPYEGHVTIPGTVSYEGFTYTVTTIGMKAFYSCKVTSVDLPSTIVTIGVSAFYRTEITSIILPESLEKIGNGAFESCTKLREVFVLGDSEIDFYYYPGSNSPFYNNYFSRKFYVKDKSKNPLPGYANDCIQYITFNGSNEFTYTGNTPEISYTNNLTFYDLNMQADIPKNAGTHTVNFRAQYSNGLEVNIPYTYTINKAMLDIEVNDAERVYGDKNPDFTYSITGFVNNEDESVFRVPMELSVFCYPTSVPGTYDINVPDHAAIADNYDRRVTRKGTLTVKKAPITVKVNDQTRLYGDKNSQATFSFEGLKNGEATPGFLFEDFKVSTVANAESEVGIYDVVASGGVADKYEFTEFQTGKLFVTPAPLTIEAQSSTRVYGSENAPFKFIYSGFKNNDTAEDLTCQPEATTDAQATSDAGSYDIVPYGAEAKNYSISYKNGTLNIQKATLLAIVGNVSRVYGVKNPEFTITYSGFVNQEDESVFLAQPQIKCQSNRLSDVGSYPIVASGAEARNYTFSYQDGVLTIGKASQEILWDQTLEGMPVGSQIELQATTTSGLPVEYELGQNDVATIYEAGGKYYLDCYGLGEVYIKAMQPGDKNHYSAVRVSKKLLVGDPNGLDEITEQPSSVTVENRKIKVSGAKSPIQVYDLSGRLVMDVEPTGDLTVIELSDAGTFIVRTKTMRTKVVLW